MDVPIASSSTLERASTTLIARSEDTPSFVIGNANKSYKYQYSNIYYMRLQCLRECVLERAERKWKDLDGDPVLVDRVLEVEKGQLCYIIGTVYLDMPLKPNVLEDIARDRSILPPAPPPKFCSEGDIISLEDESGRINLVGEHLKKIQLVTGIVIGALGIETPGGEFEVADICLPGLAPQPSLPDPPTMDVDDALQPEWVALVSGFDIGTTSSLSDILIHMLVEYLTCEGGGPGDQLEASRISRLIIAGNSLAPLDLGPQVENISLDDKKGKRNGNEPSPFSPHPIQTLSGYLLDITQVMPVHILPGSNDPSGSILPQQPFPRAMLGSATSMPWFSCETNPTYIHLETGSGEDEDEESTASLSARPVPRKFLVNSGQPLNDLFKYLESPPHTRLSILESTLKWRHMAPTAPDTLWCHPYFSADPFIIQETPDIYVVGCQKRFGTRLVSEDDDDDAGSRKCRIIMVPNFSETGILVLVDMKTLAVKTIKFMAKGADRRTPNGSQHPSSSTQEVSQADSSLSALSSSAHPDTQRG
ncbi:DNA polymerase delta small subunit Cdc1, variant 2 [Pleurotus ostreatus]|nr:DNA polymerase delta small subunit Cdc1, variant 2 [Pleurotus ostreatus]